MHSPTGNKYANASGDDELGLSVSGMLRRRDDGDTTGGHFPSQQPLLITNEGVAGAETVSGGDGCCDDVDGDVSNGTATLVGPSTSLSATTVGPPAPAAAVPPFLTAGRDVSSLSALTPRDQQDDTSVRELPCTQKCLHGLFLLFFVVFLMLGVSLSCVGFLTIDRDLPNAKYYRLLGIFSLLLCIGFFIAACVIVSECVSSALKYTSGEAAYDYEMLYPSFSDSLASARNYILTPNGSHYSMQQSNSLYSIPELPSVMSAGPTAQQHQHPYTTASPWLVPPTTSQPHTSCPSCSCSGPTGEGAHQPPIQSKSATTGADPATLWKRKEMTEDDCSTSRAMADLSYKSTNPFLSVEDDDSHNLAQRVTEI